MGRYGKFVQGRGNLQPLCGRIGVNCRNSRKHAVSVFNLKNLTQSESPDPVTDETVTAGNDRNPRGCRARQCAACGRKIKRVWQEEYVGTGKHIRELCFVNKALDMHNFFGETRFQLIETVDEFRIHLAHDKESAACVIEQLRDDFQYLRKALPSILSAKRQNDEFVVVIAVLCAGHVTA